MFQRGLLQLAAEYSLARMRVDAVRFKQQPFSAPACSGPADSCIPYGNISILKFS